MKLDHLYPTATCTTTTISSSTSPGCHPATCQWHRNMHRSNISSSTPARYSQHHQTVNDWSTPKLLCPLTSSTFTLIYLALPTSLTTSLAIGAVSLPHRHTHPSSALPTISWANTYSTVLCVGRQQMLHPLDATSPSTSEFNQGCSLSAACARAHRQYATPLDGIAHTHWQYLSFRWDNTTAASPCSPSAYPEPTSSPAHHELLAQPRALQWMAINPSS